MLKMLNKHYKNISHSWIRITKRNYKLLNTLIYQILKKAIFYKFQVFYDV